MPPKYKAKNGKLRVRPREGQDDIAMGKQGRVPGLGRIRGVKQDYRISRESDFAIHRFARLAGAERASLLTWVNGREVRLPKAA